MAVTFGKKGNAKLNDFKNTPKSTLSKHKFLTKPENRERGDTQGTVDSANKTLAKVFR